MGLPEIMMICAFMPLILHGDIEAWAHRAKPRLEALIEPGWKRKGNGMACRNKML